MPIISPMKAKKLYIDPSLDITEFPAGVFEVYTPSTTGGENNLLISPFFAGKTVWEKRHTMLRFYVFSVGVVISWRVTNGKRMLSVENGFFSASIGKLVFNVFPKRINGKEEK